MMRSSHEIAGQALNVELELTLVVAIQIKVSQLTPWRIRSKHKVTMANQSMIKVRFVKAQLLYGKGMSGCQTVQLWTIFQMMFIRVMSKKNLITFTLSQQGQWLRKCAMGFPSFFIWTTKIKIVFIMLRTKRKGQRRYFLPPLLFSFPFF